MHVTDTGAPVNELIDAVKHTIIDANISATNPARDLRVSAVHLTLNTIAASTAGGHIELRVPFVGMKLRLGASVTRNDTHTVEITLVPPDLAPRHEIREAPVETALLDAIASIRSVIAHASGGTDPFRLQSGTVTLAFAITRSGTISLGADGEHQDDVTHTLRLDLDPVPG